MVALAVEAKMIRRCPLDQIMVFTRYEKLASRSFPPLLRLTLELAPLNVCAQPLRWPLLERDDDLAEV
jgi:hypothetical protein